MNILFEYINYRLNAKFRHGIHSPFVFDLTDKAFRIPLNFEEKEQIQAHVKQLKKNQQSIEIQDFGAGSKKLGNLRKISSIYATSSSRGKYGKFLFQLARHLQPTSILEMGTSLGVGTLHLHIGNPTAKITTIDACSNTQKTAIQYFPKSENVSFINQTFIDFLSQTESTTFDIIFVDGHHDGEALKKYMLQLEAFSHDETIFVLDDIRWSDSMLNAWNELRSEEKYHVSIDLFRMGILVKRPHQQKEHFVLRLS